MDNGYSAALNMMLADLLQHIMSYIDDCTKLSEHITEQIRELLQVKAVVLVQCAQLHLSTDDSQRYRILNANPVECCELEHTELFDLIIQQCHEVHETIWLDAATPQYSGLISGLGYTHLVVVPLKFSTIRVGSLLLFDVFNQAGKTDIVSTMQQLSGVIATVLYNSLQLDTMGKLVAQRTANMMASEQRFKVLAERATDIIWTVDEQGRVRYINPAVKNVLGYTPEELIGTNIMQIVPQDEINLLANLLLQAREDASSNTILIETTLIHQKGGRVPVEISSNAVFDKNGGFEYHLAITRDISERLRINEQNERNRKMMEAVVSSTQDGIIIVQDGIIAFANEAACNLLKYPEDALQGTDFHDIIAKRDRDMVYQHYIDRLAGADIPHIYNVLMLTETGEEIISEINASIMEYNGKPSDLIFLRDIRQRVKNMEEVTAAETQFRVFMDAIPGAAFIKDENLRLIFINDYMKTILGADEWLDRKMSEVLSPELARMIEDNDRAALQKGYAIQNEKLPLEDGRVISYEVYKFSYQLPNGRILLGGIAIDATDRLAAEAAILKSEKRLKRAMDLTDLGSVIYYVDSGTMEWSENFPKMLGYDYGITPHLTTLIDHLHPDDKEEVFSLVASLKPNQIMTMEFRYLRSNDVRHCRAIVEMVESSSGEISWVNGIVQDITVEKENAAKLKDYNASLEREVQERTRTLQKSQDALTYLLEDVNEIRSDLEQMNEKLLVETAERKRNEQLVTLQSDTLKKLTLGIGQKEILHNVCAEVHRLFSSFGCGILLVRNKELVFYTQAGMHVCTHEQFCTFSADEEETGCGNAVQSKQAVYVTDIATSSDESSFASHLREQGFKAMWCEPLMSKKNNVLGVLVLACKEPREPSEYEKIVLNNASKLSALVLERKEDEEQERFVTMRLQEANKDLESFAYSVSHDLRAPLRHIDGYATALRSNILETLSNTDQHYLARITDSAKRMGTLIDDLLVFSRMGRRELIKRRVSFDQLIQGCMIELEPEYHERKIEWDIQHLGTIYADPNLFKQVMINLLSNALKFTQTKPVAHITVGKKVYDDGRIEYYVKDNGVGFDMKYSNKLFGVFQRLHRDDEFKGTGIGLANVKRIISRHGGTITATAAVNEGACFTFVIPQD